MTVIARNLRGRLAIAAIGVTLAAGLSACGGTSGAAAPASTTPSASAPTPPSAPASSATPSPTDATSSPSAPAATPPEPSTTSGPASISSANLVTVSDLAAVPAFGKRVGKATDYPANQWGQATVSMCQKSTQLGQTRMVLRDFSAIDTTEVVLGFASSTDASAARATLLQWYKSCNRPATKGTGAIKPGGFTGQSVQLSVTGSRTPIRAVAGGAVQLDSATSIGQFEDAVIVQTGDRLAWLIVRVHGQDNNCSILKNDPAIGQCGVFASADQVAKRLMK